MLSECRVQHLTALNESPLSKPFGGNIAHTYACATVQFKRVNTARLLAHNFLRVGSGEWISLFRPFSGKQRDLGAIRSFLHLRGDLEQMRLRSA